MNIADLKILKQTNGKYALWNDKELLFELYNQNSVQDICDYILRRVNSRLRDTIYYDAKDDHLFKVAVQEYKIKHGLDSEPVDTAKVILAEMGEWEPGS